MPSQKQNCMRHCHPLMVVATQARSGHPGISHCCHLAAGGCSTGQGHSVSVACLALPMLEWVLRFDWTSPTYADTLDCLIYLLFSSLPRSPCTIRSGSGSDSTLCTILSAEALGFVLYDINLRATHTTILSIRDVQIPIDLVSSAMDSFREHVVLFKPVRIPTSDLKSEFLCQSSLYCTEPADPPLNTLYAWEISHALITTYHPYCRSPSALTESLKQKLRHQRAKRLGRSHPTQVEQYVPLKRNSGLDACGT